MISANQTVKMLLGAFVLAAFCTGGFMPFVEAALAKECAVNHCEHAGKSHEDCLTACHHECTFIASLPSLGLDRPAHVFLALPVSAPLPADGVRAPIDHPPQLS